MILYALRCAAGHKFEGWFPGSAAFEAQLDGGEIACPTCGTGKVEKALMAPALGSGGGAPRHEKPAVPSEGTHTLTADPRAKALAEAIAKLRRHVVENADYVGEKFPDEARRIHYQETEHRSIYGEASIEDARALLDEGIEVQPLPRLPDEQN